MLEVCLEARGGHLAPHIVPLHGLVIGPCVTCE